MEGRDIGSVVFPAANVKIFLDADAAERVRRRAQEMAADPARVSGEIQDRDQRVRARSE
jgi:cytidylate kinase